MKSLQNRALIVMLLMPFLFSCSTYQMRMNDYSNELQSHQYTKAIKSIEKNKLLKHQRNQLLYNLELGRLYMLDNNPQKSNEYFNIADGLLESNFKNFKDIAVSNLTNPMQETYRGEDYEKLMVNYFKAINYTNEGKIEDAVVEARRMTLASDRLKEKFKDKPNRYSKDPFIFNLQGMIYEMNGDWNNAFIAYRNAADVYVNSNSSYYYGVEVPHQLKQDLLYAAYKMGFTDEQNKYETLFNEQLSPTKSDTASELVLFLEEGYAPVKEDNSILITSVDGRGAYQYMDRYGNYVSIPFDYRSYGIREDKLSDVRTLKISLPSYKVVYDKKNISSIQINGTEFQAELAQNFNVLATQTFDERYLTEIAKAMARFIVKKTVELGSQKVAEKLAEKKETENSAEKEKDKKNAEDIGKAVGFLVNVANTITEKADTRTWLSLPAYISYVRIPLSMQENKITLTYMGKNITLNVKGQKGLQLKSINLN